MSYDTIYCIQYSYLVLDTINCLPDQILFYVGYKLIFTIEKNDWTFQDSRKLFDRINCFVMTIQTVSNEILKFLLKTMYCILYDTIYCIEYSYLVLDTIYFARSKFCPSEVGTGIVSPKLQLGSLLAIVCTLYDQYNTLNERQLVGRIWQKTRIEGICCYVSHHPTVLSPLSGLRCDNR